MTAWEDDLDANLFWRSQGPTGTHRDPQGPTGTHSIVPCRGSRMSGSLLCVVNLDFSGNFRSWGSTCMSSGYQARHHEIQEMLHWLLHDNGWEMLRVWKFMWLMVQNRLSNRDLQDELKHLSHARHQIGTTQVMESWPSRVGLRQLLLKSFHAPRKHYPCHGDWPCTTKIVGYAVAWCSKSATTCCFWSLCVFPTSVSHAKQDYFLRISAVIQSKPIVSCNFSRLF